MAMTSAESAERGNMMGVLLMAVSMVFFGTADTIAKFMTAGYPALQVVGIRQMGLLVGVLIYVLLRGTSELRTRRPKMQLFRGLCATVSATLFVLALRHIPLADATAIAFVAPFFVTILGAILLKEKVDAARWAAIGLGFLGMVVVIRPGFDSFHPAYLLVLASAALFATRQVISRFLGATEKTITTVAFTAATSAGILALVQPFVWQTIKPGDIWLFVLYACAAGLGEFLVINALEIAEAVVVAPLQYTMIIWTTCYGFLVFGDVPDVLTICGTAIIVASGAYTLQRSRMKPRRIAPPAGH
jgi:S-adenosylmethionine uptake transporter